MPKTMVDWYTGVLILVSFAVAFEHLKYMQQFVVTQLNFERLWHCPLSLNKQETRRSHSSLLLRLWYTTWDGNKRKNNIILIGLSWMPIPNLIIDWLGFQKVKVPGAFHQWSHLLPLWPTHHCTNHSVCQLQRCPCSRCQRTCRLLATRWRLDGESTTGINVTCAQPQDNISGAEK